MQDRGEAEEGGGVKVYGPGDLVLTGDGPYVDDDPPTCRVYWGSHGCRLPRGHDGQHECCVTAPYHGRLTRFYGEDLSFEERIVASLPRFVWERLVRVITT